jgi:integrase/recombinase XerD
MNDKQSSIDDFQTHSSETTPADEDGPGSETDNKTDQSTLPNEINLEANTSGDTDEQSETETEPQEPHDTASLNTSAFDTGHPLTDEIFEKIAGAEVTESTADTYADCATQWNQRLDQPLLKIEVKDVKDVLRDMAQDGLAKKTISVYLAVIKRIYKYIRIETDKEAAIDLFELDELSAEDFNAPAAMTTEPLEPDELEKLVDSINERRNQLYVLVCAETGARNESLRLIRVDDVDLNKREIELRNTKAGGTYDVPISRALTLELERWLTVQRDAYVENPENEFLFPSKAEGSIGGNHLRQIIVSAAKRADIQNEPLRKRPPTDAEKRRGVTCKMIKYYRVTPHTLRHTFAYFLEQAGLATDHISDALDHDSTETTETYLHAESDYNKMVRRFLHNDEIDDDDDDDDFNSPAEAAL